MINIHKFKEKEMNYFNGKLRLICLIPIQGYIIYDWEEKDSIHKLKQRKNRSVFQSEPSQEFYMCEISTTSAMLLFNYPRHKILSYTAKISVKTMEVY